MIFTGYIDRLEIAAAAAESLASNIELPPADAKAMVAELRAAQLERDQLSRDASDARRQLGVARATVVRLDAELRAAREVVEATRASTGPGWLDRVHAARDAYDQAVSHAD